MNRSDRSWPTNPVSHRSLLVMLLSVRHLTASRGHAVVDKELLGKCAIIQLRNLLSDRSAQAAWPSAPASSPAATAATTCVRLPPAKTPPRSAPAAPTRTLHLLPSPRPSAPPQVGFGLKGLLDSRILQSLCIGAVSSGSAAGSPPSFWASVVLGYMVSRLCDSSVPQQGCLRLLQASGGRGA